MTLRLISQDNDTGCFIACVGMMLGKSYQEAFRLLHPGKNSKSIIHGFHDLSMENTVHKLLRSLGFKTHTGKYKKFSSYQKYSDKHAIMIIRWNSHPNLCHCIMFDAENKCFIEVDGGYVIKNSYEIRRLQRQLDCAIVIDKIPKKAKRRDVY